MHTVRFKFRFWIVGASDSLGIETYCKQFVKMITEIISQTAVFR